MAQKFITFENVAAPQGKQELLDYISKAANAKTFTEAEKQITSFYTVASREGNSAAKAIAIDMFTELAKAKERANGQPAGKQNAELAAFQQKILDVYVPAAKKALDIVEEASKAPPKTVSKDDGFMLKIKGEYAEAVQKIRTTFSILDNYNNLDNLSGLANVFQVLDKQIDDLNSMLALESGNVVAEYQAKLKSDLNSMARGLSPYFRGAVDNNGNFNMDLLQAKVDAVAQTVSKMNYVDSKINIYAQSGKATLPSVARDPSAGAAKADFERIGVLITNANLASINALGAGQSIDLVVSSARYHFTRLGDTIQTTRDTTLSPSEKVDIRTKISDLAKNKDALDYVSAMRYGADGKGFAPAIAALGFKPIAGASVGENYAAASNAMLDNYDKIGEYATKTALMYSQAYSSLVALKVNVQGANSLVELRDAFDPFSRLALFKTVQDGGIPGSINDDLLNQMALSAQYMPSSTAGLIFGSKDFFFTLAQLPDDGLRQQVFNQAVILISNMYANSTNSGDAHQNYENSRKLMNAFEKLDALGTLASEIETQRVYGLERGHIGLKTPWQDMRFDRTYSMSTLESFSRSTLRATPLFGWSIYTPRVYHGTQYTQTDANFLFDQAHGEKNRYLQTMPSARSLTVDYSPNNLERQASYGIILGKMNDAYNAILSAKMSKFKVAGASGTIQGSGTSQGGRGYSADAQAWMQGTASGQNMYLEAFQNWSTTLGSKYSPGQFSKFDQGSSTETFVQLQANQLNVLGTNIWQGYANFSQANQKTSTDSQGNPVTVGGLTDDQMQRYLNVNLNSTFLGYADGTMLVNISESARRNRPVLTASGAGQESEERYDVDMFVKKGNTWDHTIFRGRTREFLESSAGGNQTVGDAVNLYFTHLYSQLGKRTIVDAAVEVGRQDYGWDKNGAGIGTDNRLGVMLILQPGANFALGGVSTTTGDKAGLAGFQNKANVVHGGFYSFSNLQIPTSGQSGLGAVPYSFGINNYYIPTYELDEKQPKETADKTYIGSATWLALGKFRASVFGGWNTSDRGVLAGEDFRLKNANVSSFMSFDSAGNITSGIVSVGGRKEKVFGAENVNLRGHMYALQTLDKRQELGTAVSFRVGKGTMTVTCNLNPDQWGAASIDDITLRRIMDNSQSIVDYVNTVPAETLLDIKAREPVMRQIRDRITQVVAEAILMNPTNDLYKSFLNNVSIGYRDAKSDWTVTASTTDDQKTFMTGMFNYRDRVGVIGGYKIGGSARPEGIDWLAGMKWRLGKGNTAFSVYVSQTNDQRIIGNADFANRKIGAASVSFGKDYYRVHVLAGPETLSGIVNITSIGTASGSIQNQEYGLRVALWAPVFLTGAYSHTTATGMKDDLLQNALYATASQYGLFPAKIDINAFKADLYFKVSENSTFSVTGQMSKMSGKENPWDFYFGGKFIWNIK